MCIFAKFFAMINAIIAYFLYFRCFLKDERNYEKYSIG